MTTKTKSVTDEQRPGAEGQELGPWKRLKARLERRMARDRVLVAHAERVLEGRPALWPVETNGITPASVSAAVDAGIHAGTVEYDQDVAFIAYARPMTPAMEQLQAASMKASRNARGVDWEELEDRKRARLGKKRRACFEAAERICKSAKMQLTPLDPMTRETQRDYLVEDWDRPGEYTEVSGPLPTTPVRVYEMTSAVVWYGLQRTGRDHVDYYRLARMIEQAMEREGIAPPQKRKDDWREIVAGMIYDAIERCEPIDPDAMAWCEYDKREEEIRGYKQEIAAKDRIIRRHKNQIACMRAAEAIAHEVGAKHWIVETDGDVTPSDNYVAVPEAPESLPTLYEVARAAARFQLKRPAVDVEDMYKCELWAHEAMERHKFAVPGVVTALAKERIRIAADEAKARGMEVAAEILEWCQPAEPQSDLDGGA